MLFGISSLLSTRFSVVENEVFAFSIGTPTLSLILPILALGFLPILLRLESLLSTIGIPMIMIGGISNVLERLTAGYVNDYFNFFGLWKFNLADIFISFGAFMIILGLIWKPKR